MVCGNHNVVTGNWSNVNSMLYDFKKLYKFPNSLFEKFFQENLYLVENELHTSITSRIS